MGFYPAQNSNSVPKFRYTPSVPSSMTKQFQNINGTKSCQEPIPILKHQLSLCFRNRWQTSFKLVSVMLNFALFADNKGLSGDQPRGLVVRVSDYWLWDPGFDSVLPWGFFLEGEVFHGDHGLGSLVAFKFKAPPSTSYSYITIHLIGTT
jgi:hypothetical protein